MRCNGYLEDICAAVIIETSAPRCSEKIVYFPSIFSILRHLIRQHWAAIGCTKTGQPIGVTVNSYYFDYLESLFQRYVDEGWVAEDCEKKNNFSLTPCTFLI